MNTFYQDLAREAGYSQYSDEDLKEIGMAVERAECDWSYYEASDKGSRQYNDILAVFSCSDESPTLDATVGAYAEGIACGCEVVY